MEITIRETVLVCDDDVDVAKALKTALSAEFKVYIAHEVATAIDMLRISRNSATPDEKYTAVIIDLAFDPKNPKNAGLNEDGFFILREAIRDPYIEPIIFTGTGDEGKVIKAMDLCAFRYVAKNKRKADMNQGSVWQEQTISDVEQVVRAVKSASRIRAALLRLDSISPQRAMPYDEVVHLKQCLLHLRRPILVDEHRKWD